MIPVSFDYVLSCDSGFLMVDNRVTCDYDLAEGHILGWGYLREVVASKDFVASSGLLWPGFPIIFYHLIGEFYKVEILVLISQRF